MSEAFHTLYEICRGEPDQNSLLGRGRLLGLDDLADRFSLADTWTSKADFS